MSLSLETSYPCSKATWKCVTWESRKRFILIYFYHAFATFPKWKVEVLKVVTKFTRTSVTRSLDHPTSYNERSISIITLSQNVGLKVQFPLCASEQCNNILLLFVFSGPGQLWISIQTTLYSKPKPLPLLIPGRHLHPLNDLVYAMFWNTVIWILITVLVKFIGWVQELRILPSVAATCLDFCVYLLHWV